jgi:hypothetical protein
MGIKFKGRQLLSETVLMSCDTCKKLFSQDCKFCPECGNKLKSAKTKIFANYSKNGLTSISYVLPNGTTFNTKRGMTMSLGNGISYTTK